MTAQVHKELFLGSLDSPDDKARLRGIMKGNKNFLTLGNATKRQTVQ